MHGSGFAFSFFARTCRVVLWFFFGAVTSSQQGRHGGNSRLLIYFLYYFKTHSTANKPKKSATVPEGAVALRGVS
jgi:hypothetical protein